jgi:hypothetical protein
MFIMRYFFLFFFFVFCVKNSFSQNESKLDFSLKAISVEEIGVSTLSLESQNTLELTLDINFLKVDSTTLMKHPSVANYKFTELNFYPMDPKTMLRASDLKDYLQKNQIPSENVHKKKSD